MDFKRAAVVSAVLLAFLFIANASGYTNASANQGTASTVTALSNYPLEGIPQALRDSITATLDTARYRIVEQDSASLKSYSAPNPAQGFDTSFTPQSVILALNQSDENTQVDFSLQAYGYGNSLLPVASALPFASGNNVVYQRGDITEWYINDSRGVEQGFTLMTSPGRADHNEGFPLAIAITIESDLKPYMSTDGQGVEFLDDTSNVALTYRDLFAYDSTGRDLPSSMKLVSNTELRLYVDDSSAVYPIVVDPLIFSDSADELTGSNATNSGDRFGFSVAIDGSTAVVGAPSDETTDNNRGVAYVFELVGNTWTEQAIIQANTLGNGDEFGASVALDENTVDGTTIVVGAPSRTSNRGSVYVFTEPTLGWDDVGNPDPITEDAILTASDAGNGDRLGFSVGISGDTVVAGAPRDDDSTSNTGAVYLFLRPSTGWATGTQDAKLKASDASSVLSHSWLGTSVAISGGTVIAGAPGRDNGAFNSPGSAYVFEEPALGWDDSGNPNPITEDAKLVAADSGTNGDRFGASVAIIEDATNGDTAVVGMPFNNPNTNTDDEPGSVFIFEESDSDWDNVAGSEKTETEEITSSDGVDGDRFGLSVSIFRYASGIDGVVVGAPFDDDGTDADAGSAYLYDEPTGGWGASTPAEDKTTADTILAGANFGTSVSISGDTVFIGAPLDEVSSTDVGVVHVFAATFPNQPPDAVDDNTGGGAIGFTTDEDTSFTTGDVLANDSDDNDAVGTLTITLSNIGTTGNVSDNGDGTFDYDPNGQFDSLGGSDTATDTFTYTLTDSQNATSTPATVSITINGINDEPTIDAISNPSAINEDAGLQTVNLSGIAAGGGETQTLTVTASSDNTGLIPNPSVTYASPNATGSLSYTPVANQSGSAVITVTVQDNGGTLNGGDDTIQETFTVTVNPVNDEPTLNAISNPSAIDEDAGQQTVNISGIGAGGGESQTLTVTAVSDTPGVIPNPTVTYTSPNATGSLSYTPVADAFGSAIITVTVQDDGGTLNGGDDSVSQTFTVNVNSVNDEPVNSVPVSQSTNEDTALVFSTGNSNLISISDVDAGSNDVQVELTATNGELTLNGISGLSFSFSDGNGIGAGDGTSDTLMRFRGSITNINSALDGFSFQPDADENDSTGSFGVDITTNDLSNSGSGGALSDSDSVSISVTSVNDEPTLDAISDPAAIDEDAGQQTVNLSGIGAGGGETQTLTVTASSNNTGLIPDPSVTYTSPDTTGSLSYTPVSDAFGSAIITVTVQDDGGTLNGGDDAVSQTFTVTVNPINDEPTIDAISNPSAINEDAGIQTVNLSGIGAGGGESQTLTVTAVSDTPGLIPNPSVSYTSPNATGSLSYTPVANQSGSAIITVTVQDNGGTANSGDDDTIQETFTVTVDSVNDEPTLDAISDPSAIDEDSGLQTVNISGIGAGAGETQTLTVTAVSDTPGLIPNPTVTYTSPDTTGSLSYTPVGDAFGSAVITVTVQDDGGTSNGGDDEVSETFTVTVNPINDAPTLDAISDPSAINEDAGLQTLNLSGISAGPGESQTLTITADSDNTGLIPDPTVTYTSPDATGSLSYTPVADQSGTATITVTIQDDGGTANGGINQATDTFTITVNAVNDPPTFTLSNPTLTVDEDFVGTQTVTVTDTSPANETESISYSLTPDPTTVTFASVSIDSTTGEITVDPVADGNGSQSFTVTADDGQSANNIATQTFDLTVNPINDQPIGNDDNPGGNDSDFTTDEDTSFTTGNVLTNDTDVDLDTLSVTALDTTGTLGTVVDNGDGTFTYDPNGQFEGLSNGDIAQDSFSYTVSDTSLTDTATVTITITGVTDPVDLSLTKAVDDGTPDEEQQIVYTVTVTNNSTTYDATNVSVTDVLPSGVTHVSDNATSGTYDESTGVWTIGTISANSSETLTITVQVNTGTSGVLITNLAQVSASDQPDPDSVPNNSVATEDDQDSVNVTPELGNEDVSDVAGADGTVSTDDESDGATDLDPIETAVTTPTGGVIIIEETSDLGTEPSGFELVGKRVKITAPPATPADPLEITFVIDPSTVPAGQDKDTIEVFKDGVLVTACTGASGVASPDPCVSSRVLNADIEITVLTSTASDWTFGIVPAIDDDDDDDRRRDRDEPEEEPLSITVSEDRMVFTATFGDDRFTSSRSFEIDRRRDATGGPLAEGLLLWTVENIDGVPWLELSDIRGSSNSLADDIEVQVSGADLGIGTHIATLLVTGEDSDGDAVIRSPERIRVVLNVKPQAISEGRVGLSSGRAASVGTEDNQVGLVIPANALSINNAEAEVRNLNIGMLPDAPNDVQFLSGAEVNILVDDEIRETSFSRSVELSFAVSMELADTVRDENLQFVIWLLNASSNTWQRLDAEDVRFIEAPNPRVIADLDHFSVYALSVEEGTEAPAEPLQPVPTATAMPEPATEPTPVAAQPTAVPTPTTSQQTETTPAPATPTPQPQATSTPQPAPAAPVAPPVAPSQPVATPTPSAQVAPAPATAPLPPATTTPVPQTSVQEPVVTPQEPDAAVEPSGSNTLLVVIIALVLGVAIVAGGYIVVQNRLSSRREA